MNILNKLGIASVDNVSKMVTSIVLCFALMASSMFMTGCSVSSVVSDLQKFQPVITDVLTIACEFTSDPLCAIAPTINQNVAYALSLLQDYEVALANQTASLSAWNDLNAAFALVEKDASAIFALAHVVNGAHQQEILAIVASAQALLAVIETIFPAPPVAATNVMTARPAQHQFAVYLPAPTAKTKQFDRKWLNSWVGDWNSNKLVKSNKKQIHLHNVVLRAIPLAGLN